MLLVGFGILFIVRVLDILSLNICIYRFDLKYISISSPTLSVACRLRGLVHSQGVVYDSNLGIMHPLASGYLSLLGSYPNTNLLSDILLAYRIPIHRIS